MFFNFSTLRSYFTIPFVLVAIIFFVLAITHVWLVSTFSVDVPFNDDFDAVLAFAVNYLSATDFSEQFTMLFGRHNEHRILLNRLVTIGQISFTDKVSFTGMNYIASLLFLFLTVGVIRAFNALKLNAWFFLPAAFIIFSFSCYEVFLWPMVSIQTVGVIFLSFFSLFVLFGEHRLNFRARFSLGFILASFATFTGGNGFLTILLGFVGLLLTKTRPIYLISWAALSLIILYFNFKGYVSLPGHPDAIETLRSKPDQLVSHFFILIGGALNTKIPFNIPVVIFGGFFVFAIFLFFVLPRFFSIEKVTLLFLLFLILSCALTSLSRSGFGSFQAFAMRYQIYPSLIAVFLYFAGLQLLQNQKRKQLILACGVSVFFIPAYFLNYMKYEKDIFNYKHTLEQGVVAFNESNGQQKEFAYPVPEAIVPLLAQSDSLGIYRLPDWKFEYLANREVSVEIPKETNSLDFAFEVSVKDNLITIDRGWAYVVGHDYECETFVLLRGKNRIYCFTTYQNLRPDVTLAKKAGDLTLSGFSTLIDHRKMEDGVYQVGLYIRQVNTLFSSPFFGVQYTDQFVAKRKGEVLNLPATVNEQLFDKTSVKYYFDELVAANDSLKVKGWAFMDSIPSNLTHTVLVGKSDNGTFEVELTKQDRTDVSNFFQGNYDKSGAVGTRSLVGITPGNYKISLRFILGDWNREVQTESELLIN